mgnify:CR=1 FL=1
MTTPRTELSLPGLEQAHDLLAESTDQAGSERSELFHVKLALHNAHALGDADVFAAHVRSALADL